MAKRTTPEKRVKLLVCIIKKGDDALFDLVKTKVTQVVRLCRAVSQAGKAEGYALLVASLGKRNLVSLFDDAHEELDAFFGCCALCHYDLTSVFSVV